jgi:hypothetical protein
MLVPKKLHPAEVGLPARVIRRRRRERRIARWMLIVAVLTALAGWPLLGRSIFSAINLKDQSPYQAIIAYGLLIVSSATLVLGLWYLLLAQVEGVARIVEAHESDEEAPNPRLCGNCGWFFDPPDRYCRHCGKPLNTSIMPPQPGP